MDRDVNIVGNGSSTTMINGGGISDVLRISAEWVNISGFQIINSSSGSNAAGIQFEGNNITIHDCNVSGNHHGIFSLSSDNATVRSNVFTMNSKYATYVKNSVSILVEFNFYYDNNVGILIKSSQNTIITNNTSEKDSIGIVLNDSEHSIVAHNHCSYAGDGIKVLDQSYFSKIHNNTCDNNQYRGIIASNTNNISIENNSCRYNNEGILLWWSQAIHTIMNNCSYNTDGIGITKSYENITIRWNVIAHNRAFGINISNNEGNKISAIENWYGNTSGPYHGTENPEGSGDSVSDGAIIDPWLRIPLDHYLPHSGIEFPSETLFVQHELIQFRGGGSSYGGIHRYVWLSSVDQEIYNGTDSSFSISNLSVGNHTISLRVQDNYGFWSVAVHQALEILPDSDHDGVADKDDAFPEDPAASIDSDGDGYPNEWNDGKTEDDSVSGLKIDKYPDNPKKWKENDGENGGFLPGFELILLMISVILMSTVKKCK